jgi:hypothetical protein
MYVPGKPFQPSLMFTGKAEKAWKGRTLQLITNILQITAVKSFIEMAPADTFTLP